MHGTKHKYTRRVQIYDPEAHKEYYKAILGYYIYAWYSYWSGQSNRKYQQEILEFTDRKDRLNGDSDVTLKGMDGGGDEIEVQLKIENENDICTSHFH